jgi:hypothetical protein
MLGHKRVPDTLGRQVKGRQRNHPHFRRDDAAADSDRHSGARNPCRSFHDQQSSG